MVIAHRHGQVVLEPFNKDLQSQRWYIGINGELFTRIGGVTRYLDYLDGCMGLVLSSTVPIQGWAFDAMGEHPHRYRIVPRSCPSQSLRATRGSFSIGLEHTSFADDTNAWYIVTLGEMTGERIAHVRPVS